MQERSFVRIEMVEVDDDQSYTFAAEQTTTGHRDLPGDIRYALRSIYNGNDRRVLGVLIRAIYQVIDLNNTAYDEPMEAVLRAVESYCRALDGSEKPAP